MHFLIFWWCIESIGVILLISVILKFLALSYKGIVGTPSEQVQGLKNQKLAEWIRL
jgi:hypothetical protein